MASPSAPGNIAAPPAPGGPLLRQRFPRQLLAVLLAVAAAIAGAGWWWFAAEYRRGRADKAEELAAIADMKIEQIAAWREQHITNMNLISASPTLASRFALFARAPRDPALRAEMKEWLRTYGAARNYFAGSFFDGSGRFLLGEGPETGSFSPDASRVLSEAAAGKGPAHTDLHRGPGGRIEIDFCAPLFSPDGGKRLIGLVNFRCDPETFLYPLVQKWPTPSASAETMLFRQEGEEVVYLNDLRFRRDSALSLRLPLTRRSLLAVQSLPRGPGDILEGLDYRGVPVVGTSRAVPGTGWIMIAKEDREEFYGPLRRQGYTAALLVALMVLAAGGLTLLLWSRNQADFYRRLYEEETKRKAMAAHFDFFSRFSNDLVFLVDIETMRILEANDRAEQAYGYDRGELIGLDFRCFRPPDSREEMMARMAELREKGSLRYESINLRKDGSFFPVEISLRLIETKGKPFFQGIARDITERKQDEERLRASEERYRSLIESMTECVAIYRPLEGEEDFLITEFNPAAQHTEQVLLEEVVGRRLTEVFPGVKEFGILDAFLRVARTGQAEEFPLRFYQDQRISGWRDNYIYRLSSGEVAAVYWDRTREKQAEEEIRVLSERLAMATSAGAIGVWDLDVTSNRLVWDDSMYRLYGIIRDRFGGAYESWLATVHPEEKERMQREYEQALSGEKEYDTEFRVVWPDDGSVHFIKARAKVTRDPAGRPLRMVGTNWDITDRKNAAEELAAEKERLAVTLRSIGDGVIATDLEGRVLLFNKVAEELTGWKTQEAQGKPLAEVFHIVNAVTRQRCENPVEKVLASGTVVGLANHTMLLARDGRELSIADSGAPICDHDSRVIGVVLVFRDVTERERVDDELARMQKLESLAVVAGGIAHDFNNLLSGILGNISLARSEVATGSAARHLEEAERAGLRARDLTRQLLTFSHGGAPLVRCLPLAPLVEESARFAARGSAVACNLDIAPGLYVLADGGQLGQVVHNLVINAVQAMPRGGTVSLRAERIEVARGATLPLKPGSFVRLTIRDQGPGIPEGILARVFDPFFTTKEKCKGLGLAICHSIVRKHDGCIEVSSHPGGGTTFTIHLPACSGESPQMEEGGGEAGGGTAGTAGAGRRVLVMDDEEMVRSLALQMLSALGYRAAGAPDGGAALDLYRAAVEEGSPYDAVILDLTVPGGMGGKETMARLLALDPAARAIVSSGYSNDPVMANYRQLGFAGILVKPYRLEEMREMLETLFRS
jgi:PAS domain S-box-containing protein